MQCPQCWTGTCKRHPKQDSGRGLQQQVASKVADPKATLKKMYDQLVKGQLEKLEREALKNQDHEETSSTYRKEMKKVRAKAEKGEGRKLSEKEARLLGTGLNRQSIKALVEQESSDEDGRKRSKKRKRKSKDKKKDRKRKEKKKKSRKRKRETSSSSEYTSQSSSDSDSDGNSRSLNGRKSEKRKRRGGSDSDEGRRSRKSERSRRDKEKEKTSEKNSGVRDESRSRLDRTERDINDRRDDRSQKRRRSSPER